MRKTRLVIQPRKCLHTIGFLLLFMSCPVFGDWGLVQPESSISRRSAIVQEEGVRVHLKDPPLMKNAKINTADATHRLDNVNNRRLASSRWLDSRNQRISNDRLPDYLVRSVRRLDVDRQGGRYEEMRLAKDQRQYVNLEKRTVNVLPSENRLVQRQDERQTRDRRSVNPTRRDETHRRTNERENRLVRSRDYREGSQNGRLSRTASGGDVDSQRGSLERRHQVQGERLVRTVEGRRDSDLRKVRLSRSTESHRQGSESRRERDNAAEQRYARIENNILERRSTVESKNIRSGVDDRLDSKVVESRKNSREMQRKLSRSDESRRNLENQKNSERLTRSLSDKRSNLSRRDTLKLNTDRLDSERRSSENRRLSNGRLYRKESADRGTERKPEVLSRRSERLSRSVENNVEKREESRNVKERLTENRKNTILRRDERLSRSSEGRRETRDIYRSNRLSRSVENIIEKREESQKSNDRLTGNRRNSNGRRDVRLSRSSEDRRETREINRSDRLSRSVENIIEKREESQNSNDRLTGNRRNTIGRRDVRLSRSSENRRESSEINKARRTRSIEPKRDSRERSLQRNKRSVDDSRDTADRRNNQISRSAERMSDMKETRNARFSRFSDRSEEGRNIRRGTVQRLERRLDSVDARKAPLITMKRDQPNGIPTLKRQEFTVHAREGEWTERHQRNMGARHSEKSHHEEGIFVNDVRGKADDSSRLERTFLHKTLNENLFENQGWKLNELAGNCILGAVVFFFSARNQKLVY